LGAAASQAESIASTAAEATQALLKSIKKIRESSNKEQVSNKQLQALCKRVAKQEEYTILL
jgi:isopropylmalate/homocitrate/citramalate synthase